MEAVKSILPEWLDGIVTNLGLYIIVFAAGYYVMQRIKQQPEPDPSNPNCKPRFIRCFFYGPPDDPSEPKTAGGSEAVSSSEPKVELSFALRALKLLFCVAGLLFSFLSWGLLQERIMTTTYSGGKFESSNFLIFYSRAVGVLIAFIVTRSQNNLPRLKAPFYKFSFTSLSNVLSSFCQLEALKYLSFPSQVLGKSSKMIPVMIMGKVISGKTYPAYEYMIAVAIIIGVSTFVLFEKGTPAAEGKETSLAGLIFMGGYLTFDSFTSQWQNHLFKQYEMSSYQMMLGVNTFSASFTFISLVFSGELVYSVNFLLANPDAFTHATGYAICGSTGSMFIFYTIKEFGALVFTMIMTTRQLIAIILSCIFYGHSIDTGGVVGACIVFAAIGARIYLKEQDRKADMERKKREKAAAERDPEAIEEETVPLKSAEAK